MATARYNFTERALDTWVREALARWVAHPDAIPATGEEWVQDRGGAGSIPGLHLRLRLRTEGGVWTTTEPFVGFYLLKKVKGRKVNRLLGDRKIMSVEMARTEAKDLLGKLSSGVDPKEERRQAEEIKGLRAMTYRRALERFLEAADLTEGTRKKYRLSLSTTFEKVADKPLTWFTAQQVKEIHRARSLESRSRADQDMRVLRLVWNWAQRNVTTEAGEAVLGRNPVSVLNKRERGPGERGWNMVPRKQSIIPRRRLPDWFNALQQVYDDPTSTDARRVSCLLLEALCLTGLRFNELATMTWDRVDQHMGIVTIPDTTSKNRRPLVRPITRRVSEILAKLCGFSESASHDQSEDHHEEVRHVFPGRRSGQSIDNTRALQLELQTRTGLWITPHDLRRVYTSAAVRAEVPGVVIKRLLNHVGHEEVTEGYARFGLDELASYAQRVEDTILGDAGLLSSRGLDAKLGDALAALSEYEKRQLLFDLSQRKLKEVG